MKILLLSLVLLSGCTISPKPIEHQTASVWIQSHVYGYDNSGLYVDSEWLRAYKLMYATYGANLEAREQTNDLSKGVTQSNSAGFFHVTYEVFTRFADLTYLEEISGK